MHTLDPDPAGPCHPGPGADHGAAARRGAHTVGDALAEGVDVVDRRGPRYQMGRGALDRERAGQVAVALLQPGVAAQDDLVAVERHQLAREPGRPVQHPDPGGRLPVRVLRGGAGRPVDRPRQDPARPGVRDPALPGVRDPAQASAVASTRRTRRPLHRHVLDAADEVRQQPLRLTGQLHVGHARDQLGEDELQLHAGQVGAQAEVRTAAAERDVRVRVARDVEDERVVPHLFVAVGGDVPDDDAVTGLDRPAPDLGVDGRGAAEVQHRRAPAQHLLDRVVDAALGVLLQQLELLRVGHERVHAVRGRVAGGLVARHREQQHEHVELELAELLALDLGVQELGDDVVARVVAARARRARSRRRTARRTRSAGRCPCTRGHRRRPSGWSSRTACAGPPGARP